MDEMLDLVDVEVGPRKFEIGVATKVLGIDPSLYLIGKALDISND